MRKSLAALWGAIVTGLLAAAAPVAAQDAPIPRLYPPTGFERAYTGKSPETLTREAQVADSFAAACEAGDLTGCTALGTAFETGEGRPQNRPVAELLYRQACEGEAAEGCYRLGKLLRFADDRRDWGQTAPLFVRACELGSASGCDAQADDLEAGATGVSDPDAALALRRATCAGGSAPSCSILAAELMRTDRSAEEQAEGLALLDRQCRAGESRDCSDSASYWIRAEDGFGPRAREYQSLGCRARDAWACAEIGKRALRNGIGPEAREAGVAFYQRACELGQYHCDDAKAVRDEPDQRAACDLGERTACIAIAKQYIRQGGPLEDLPRGIELLSAACLTAGRAEEAQNLCETAGNLALDQATNGSDEARSAADPGRIDALYTAACAAGSNSACVNLANALWSGAILPGDQPRALVLYEALCDADYASGCKGLDKAIRTDPGAPLLVAGGDLFPPEFSPEEIAEQQRIAEEERQRREAEESERACTTTSVEFRGMIYTDTICVYVVAVIDGFAVKVGDAPWQALLWRPEKLGRKRLTPAQRVLCGGAVIRTGWVLTAAHCLTDEGGVPVLTGGHRIRLGLNNPLDDQGYTYRILRVIPHPDFQPSTFAFDVALVQYDPKGEKLGGEVYPIARIRLDPQPITARTIRARMPAYTFGWGRTALEGGAPPEELRGARLELRDLDSCTRLTSFRDKRRDAVLCAAGARGEQACFGDSGGPLITYGDAGGVPTLLGVVSAGVKCGRTSVPSRFTRIAHPLVQRWLNSVLPGANRR